MIKLNNKLYDNNLTKECLLKVVEISNTNFEDIEQISRLFADSFDLTSIEEAKMQLNNTNIDWNNSVKLYNKRSGRIYGFLLFGEHPIEVGSPLQFIDYEMIPIISQLKQINGFAFIIDERLRGCSFDKKMLFYNMEFIKQYDMIWIAVENSLKSHNYWKRIGFKEFFNIEEAVFYIKIFNYDKIIDIYNNMNKLNCHDENNIE